jgi:hypothetical protein
MQKIVFLKQRDFDNMKKFLTLSVVALLLMANGGGCSNDTNPAAERQAEATRTSMDGADREVGMPRIINYAQRKLLKNAYEDMDQTTLTYVYTQNIDGRFVCIGQAIGYGVSLGTQFTASQYPQYVQMPQSIPNVTEMMDQPEPNGLYSPNSGEATIVDLINPKTGEAHTAIMEPRIVTVPFELPASAVSVPCPDDVDPTKVKDVKETSVATQLEAKTK